MSFVVIFNVFANAFQVLPNSVRGHCRH